MKGWKKRVNSLVLAAVMAFLPATSVMADPEESREAAIVQSEAETEETAALDFIFTSEDEDAGLQYVYVSVDTEIPLRDALLTYREGNEELTAAAAMTAENIARFDLPLLGNEAREYISMIFSGDGQERVTSLLSVQEGENVTVEEETVIEAVEETQGLPEGNDTFQEADALPEELQDSVIVTEEGLSAEALTQAVETVESGQETAFSLKEEETDSRLRGAAKRNFVVVLDPGHGGKDSGTTFSYDGVTYYESEITYKIAQYTKAALERQGNITVYVTRKEPSDFLALSERVNYAVSVGADILVSQHVNSAGNGGSTTANGAEVLVPRTGRYNTEVAENAQALAKKILKKLVELGLSDRGLVLKDTANGSTYPDGSPSDYYTIVEKSMRANLPGIIVEHGFLNNEGDFNKVYSSEEKYKALGEADAAGIAAFLKTYTTADSWRWELVNGKWYYVDQDGNKKTGWLTVKGETYYLNSKGEMLTGLQTIGKKLYYFDGDGHRSYGWQKAGDDWYYFGSDGAAYKDEWYEGYYLGADGIWIPNYSDYSKYTGWMMQKGNWYYYEKGKKKTGWYFDGADWYYLRNNGVMATGWEMVNGNWYLLDGNGCMLKEWQYQNGSWYYLNQNGAMSVSSWQVVNGSWYVFDGSGRMLTGWQVVNGSWYFMDKSGRMQTGWQYHKGDWYYLKSSGAMVMSNWELVNGVWYFMDGNGRMLTGWQVINGNWYLLDKSGRMLTGWQAAGGKWYYMYDSGAMAANTWIGNYQVDASGAWTA